LKKQNTEEPSLCVGNASNAETLSAIDDVNKKLNMSKNFF
jgi:hypothetical protein